jgi:hypothetical protein
VHFRGGITYFYPRAVGLVVDYGLWFFLGLFVVLKFMNWRRDAGVRRSGAKGVGAGAA